MNYGQTPDLFSLAIFRLFSTPLRETSTYGYLTICTLPTLAFECTLTIYMYLSQFHNYIKFLMLFFTIVLLYSYYSVC